MYDEICWTEIGCAWSEMIMDAWEYVCDMCLT